MQQYLIFLSSFDTTSNNHNEKVDDYCGFTIIKKANISNVIKEESMRKTITIDDVTGKEIEDYITVSIEKEGHIIEYPKGCFTNRLEMHIEEKNLPKIMKRIKFVPVARELSQVIEVK